MSAETTPILSRAIPDFEMLMTEWERLGADCPELRFWTEIGLRWAKKYYIRMDDTDAYVVAMCKFHTGYGTPLAANFLQSSILPYASSGSRRNGKRNTSKVQKTQFWLL
jgi:hypothetical protein